MQKWSLCNNSIIRWTDHCLLFYFPLFRFAKFPWPSLSPQCDIHSSFICLDQMEQIHMGSSRSAFSIIIIILIYVMSGLSFIFIINNAFSSHFNIIIAGTKQN